MTPLPTGRLLALAALAAPAWLLGTWGGIAVDALLLLAAAVDVARIGGRERVRVERRAPSRLGLGAEAEVRITVHSRSASPLRLRVTDDVPPQLIRMGPEELEAEVIAHGTTVLVYRVRGAERGDWTLGDLHLRIRGPLGLVWLQRRLSRQDPLRVQPGLGEVRRHRILGLRDRLQSAGARRVRRQGEGTSFESLREYVRGDDPRWIDWKATARRETTMVRQWEAERSQHVLLAIDAGRLMSERIGGRERLDHALAAAILLADVARRNGDRVGALVFADRVQSFLPPSRAPLDRLADALGATQARLVEPDYPGAFAFLARQLRRRTLLVLFSDVIDPAASAALVSHLTASVRRHVPLVVALRNPELEAAATLAVHEDADAFTRAAAEELLGARALALAAMGRAGVLVADVRPGDAVPAVVNRYLEVKRRGLL